MYEALKKQNLNRWNNVEVKQDHIAALDHIASRLIATKTRYQNVEAKTKVPWPVIAVIHEREASQSWTAALAQGDPWDRVSTHVPKGRGPYASWEAAAIDALTQTDHLSTWGDWSIEGTLSALEKYNGLGYFNKKVPSPYIWSFTNQYKSGKYVGDGNYKSGVVDTQPGCAALLIRMMVEDPSIAPTYKWSTKINTSTSISTTNTETAPPVQTEIETAPPERTEKENKNMGSILPILEAVALNPMVDSSILAFVTGLGNHLLNTTSASPEVKSLGTELINDGGKVVTAILANTPLAKPVVNK